MMDILKNEFARELFVAGEVVSGLIFNAPWHSDCRYVARKTAIDYLVKNYLAEYETVCVTQGVDAVRQELGWDEDMFCRHAQCVADAIGPSVKKAGDWRRPQI